MPATNHAIHQSLDYSFRGISYTLPTSFYLGVSMADIDSNGLGFSEPDDPSYSRQEMPRNSATWTEATASGSSLCAIYNAVPVQFKKSSEHWGTVREIFLSSGSSGSEIWYHQALDPTVPILEETLVTFPIESIKLARK